ncbi:MAG TPA: YciI family protein [Streptosporangiaceae bacterium]
MKYMLLIHNNQSVYESWSDDERQALFAEVMAIMAELKESGELITDMALADQSLARTVRVRDGAVTTTDGPFAEAKEQFAGFLAVDCETPERAIEIAARWPDAKYFAMEVRPIMHDGGADL